MNIMRAVQPILIACFLSIVSVSAAAPAAAGAAKPAEGKPLPMGSEGTLIVADFDSWEEVNNLGGLFSSWTRDPDDPTQGCRVEITDDDRWGEKGLCVRLIYDVESPGIAFNGMWIQLEETDWSRYRYFIVHVRGDREAGFTPRFKIEMKNKQKAVGRFVITGVTDDWQEFVIPLSKFKGLDNLKVMKEITISFDDMRCSPKVGEIYIDDIYLSK
ncbi:MAG: hypothetical protein V1929_07370 [bacterium]